MTRELHKPFKDKYEEIQFIGKSHADNFKTIMDKLDIVSTIIQKDVDTAMENANSHSSLSQTAQNAMWDAVNFLSGSTQESKVGNLGEKILVAKEILILIPRVTASWYDWPLFFEEVLQLFQSNRFSIVDSFLERLALFHNISI